VRDKDPLSRRGEWGQKTSTATVTVKEIQKEVVGQQIGAALPNLLPKGGTAVGATGGHIKLPQIHLIRWSGHYDGGLRHQNSTRAVWVNQGRQKKKKYWGGQLKKQSIKKKYPRVCVCVCVSQCVCAQRHPVRN
jgi:hypothetical protein